MRSSDPGILGRIKGMQHDGEGWKQRKRHSQYANGAARLPQAPAEVVQSPIQKRIEAMKADGETWKFKERHSKRKDTVLDPKTDTVETVKPTAGGHMVRQTVRRPADYTPPPAEQPPATTATAAARKIEIRKTAAGHAIRATVRQNRGTGEGTAGAAGSMAGAGPAPEIELGLEMAAATIGDSDNFDDSSIPIYAEMVFEEGTVGGSVQRRQSHDDVVIYTNPMSFTLGELHEPVSPTSAAMSPLDDPNYVHPEEPPGSSDDSDLDSEEEAKYLYDNEEYTGTKGFVKKRGALKMKRVQKAVAVATKKEQDTEDEPAYDNTDYTGSHPEIRKQEGIRRKKTDNDELGQSET